MVKKIRSRIILFASIGAWLVFCIFYYRTSAARIIECQDELSGTQADICVRVAMESRDFVFVWGFGTPFLIAMFAAFVHAIWRIERRFYN